MKYNISVITSTFRQGFIDTMLMGLLNQEWNGKFEWVLVDELYDKREMLINNISNIYNLPIKHIPPRELKPYTALASSWNTGLLHAQGELIFFMNDYGIISSDTLRHHWDTYVKYKPKVTISGPLKRVDTVIWDEQLVIDHPDYFLFSILREPIELNFDKIKPERPLLKTYEDKGSGVYKFRYTEFWAGRNDSCPLKSCLELNGFYEGFDGKLERQDTNFGARLVNRLDHLPLYDSKTMVLEQKHKFLGKSQLSEREDPNTDKHGYKSNWVYAPNGWDIKEKRSELGYENP